MKNNRIEVLLVDDHAVVRNGVRLMLSIASDIVVTGEAETAYDALRLAGEQHFDVALVDIAMPGRSGLELLKQLRAEYPGLAVLILSMYSEEVYAVRAIKHGAAGYLTKSTSAETLVAAVRKAAAGGKHISAAFAENLASMLAGRKMSHEALSDRELEVLKRLATGDSLVKIAETLHLSASTVTTYRLRILEKMDMKSNVELARYALESGLVI
ncbi:MAG: response regulator transcription factor [Pseudomonadota bacterium]